MSSNWKKRYLKNRSYYLSVAAQYSQRTDIKAYLEILLSLTTVIIFAIFALRPTLITIAGLIKEIDSKEETIEKMDDKIQKLARAQSLFDQQRPNILLLSSAVPDNSSPDSFARQIEGLSTKHESTITDIVIGSSAILGTQSNSDQDDKLDLPPLAENSNSLNFSVTTTVSIDNYTSIHDLLNDLERLRRPVKIDSLKINVSEANAVKNLNMVITGRLPYLKN